MGLSERQLDDLRLTARGRRKELKTRIIIAFFGATVLAVEVEPVIGLAWLAIVLFSQLVDFLIWRPAFRAEPVPISEARLNLIAASAFQASLIYSAVAALLWFLGNPADGVFSFVWFAGSLLHVTLHMRNERRTFVAAAIPHALYFIGIPILAVVGYGPASRASGVIMLIAVLLYLAHLVVAFRTTRQLSLELLDARKNAEHGQREAERANKAKSDFLSSTSHEIRTPLNGVLGMAEALKQDDLTPAAMEKVEILQDSGLLLLRLLNDILDLSKIEAGRIELEEQPIDLALIADKVVRTHAMTAEAKGIKLGVTVQEGYACLRMGDELRLMQILNNLVSNALKFTSEGGIRIHIKEDEPTGHVMISVRDTGIGMSDEQLNVIMEPFTQADKTISRRYGGTGLGLAIVNGLAHGMGGDVNVTSKLGEGTSFTVRLPLELCAEKQSLVSQFTDESEELSVFPGVNVLVTDDNQVNRMVLESYLGSMQARVVMAEDGRTAIQSASEMEFDLILMDISMPDMEGTDAMSAIRREQAARGVVGKGTPIIAVTAHALAHEISGFLEAGFDGYLAKPISMDALRKVMAEFAGKKAGETVTPRMTA
ncbi:ATP-binding protein [Parvularcula marina]|uniref:histidine kinase n=1 Tax=Parvularcula marina TaxID=2292771 RepID=A0A371RIJ7_9PROT|nr:ATP-binding protein [Parvularcula marina]RFB05271.1 response regulator [Parvularcula marina]